ncbi:MAG TPA: hypothetical protein V6D17_17470 [Candidatus Obscuribacterales bacterium]
MMFCQQKVKIVIISLTFIVFLGLLEPIRALAQSVPATNPGTGLNAQQQQFTARIAQLRARLTVLMGDTNPANNAVINEILTLVSELSVLVFQQPQSTVPAAQAAGQAGATAGGNAAGDVARDQAITAIDYSSRFLKNFTVDPGNKWNKLRDQLFVPIAVLLLLPGAVLAQVRAVVAAGSPIVGQVSPFEGIQRSLIAIFLIPGSYLVVNYSIDFANSIQFTVATEYTRLFGTNMYKDAICAQIRAFGVRYLPENDGSLQTPPADTSATNNGPFSQAEGRLWGKLVDPCSGLYRVPRNRDDASMPASTIATRLMMNVTNASINTCWAILCAFQMAFFYYLYFVGPIMAALWVWPMKQFRDAFPSWIEGVITLTFWSLFWHTTILLMACFKGTDDTGLFMMSALNFLATACVKHAFDFGGLVRAAGGKAAELIEKAGKQGGGGGGGGSGADQTPAAAQQGAPIVVAQEQIGAAQGHPINKYQDDNNDGRVDRVWVPDPGPNPLQGHYIQAREEMFLVSTTMPPSGSPVVPIPPGDTPVLVSPEGYIRFRNPQTGEWEMPTEVDPVTGKRMPKYILVEGNRVAVFDPQSGRYVIPQTLDREAHMNVDKYRLVNGQLWTWDQADFRYEDVGGMPMPLRPVPVRPGSGHPDFSPPPLTGGATFSRDTVSSRIGLSIQPVFHYPLSAKLIPPEQAAAKPRENACENASENAEAGKCELPAKLAGEVAPGGGHAVASSLPAPPSILEAHKADRIDKDAALCEQHSPDSGKGQAVLTTGKAQAGGSGDTTSKCVNYREGVSEMTDSRDLRAAHLLDPVFMPPPPLTSGIKRERTVDCQPPVMESYSQKVASVEVTQQQVENLFQVMEQAISSDASQGQGQDHAGSLGRALGRANSPSLAQVEAKSLDSPAFDLSTSHAQLRPVQKEHSRAVESFLVQSIRSLRADVTRREELIAMMRQYVRFLMDQERSDEARKVNNEIAGLTGGASEAVRGVDAYNFTVSTHSRF